MNPTVQEWVSKALNDPPEDQDELWENAKDIVAEQQDERNWYDDAYTLEEREAGIEGIETGISERKKEEKKDVGVPGLKLESMLRFMETGVLPAEQPPLPMAVMPGAGSMKR
jgi:mediator of RNA polymerase II transcription subunit 8